MNNGINYNPNPPRAWSRVQNLCSITTEPNNQYLVYVPLTKKTVPPGVANYKNKMIYKGNILQYKKNSSQLTSKQRYSQISKGMWTSRTKNYATQSQTYTNPNTNSLLRTNYYYTNLSPEILDTNMIEDVKNILCDPSPVPANNPLPPQPPSSYTPPFVLPPPAVGSGPSITIPPPVRVPATIQWVLPTGGNLVCNTIASPCNDVIREIFSGSNQKCYPSTDSNVPGPIVPLCWNSALPTYYPRQRYTYGVSSNKFPVNSKAIFPVT
jgi:hypothetical protein